NVTVALSGLGGDEVFAGYERYLGFALSRLYEKLPVLMKENLIRRFIETLPERADGHYTVDHMKRFVCSASLPKDLRYFSYCSMLSGNLRESLFAEPDKVRDSLKACREFILSYFNSPNASNDSRDNKSVDILNRVFYCDIKTYLPEDILTLTDRMSMLHALEVRVPFVDHALVEFSATIPPEMKLKWFRKKYLLKKAVADLLPRDVIEHRKQGFASPMARWLRTELKPYVLETLSEKNLRRHGLLNLSAAKSILNNHFNLVEMNDKLIWSMLIFQKWFDTYMS
ncbi:MAG: asparagine synthase-related protein, partial [Candidatus Hodarchaeota archaeon]